MKKSKIFYTILLAIVISLIGIITSASAQYEYYGGLFAGACIFWVILWFVIFILIAIWVYRDAERRDSNGALWLIIVILLGLIGIIIWLIVRPPIGGKTKKVEDDRRCTNCGRIIPTDARRCPYCSKDFEVKEE
jgi:cell division protein FtsW (lipid II flippase)